MTAILGVLNITPNSFFDGGQFLEHDQAVLQAQTLFKAGADVIDLGPSSSHPDAPVDSSAVEIERMAHILDALLALKIPLSVDSFHTETQRYAITKGVAILNDIHGFPYPAFYPELADADCKLIVMHNVHGTQPAKRIVTDATVIMSRIFEFFHERLSALMRAGIASERLIIDPGMGFFLSSEPEASLMVLQNLAQLRREFNLPVLVGVSRKSFIQKLTGQTVANADAGTLSAELFAANQGVDWIRTHNVRALRDGLFVQSRLNSAVSTRLPEIA